MLEKLKQQKNRYKMRKKIHENRWKITTLIYILTTEFQLLYLLSAIIKMKNILGLVLRAHGNSLLGTDKMSVRVVGILKSRLPVGSYLLFSCIVFVSVFVLSCPLCLVITGWIRGQGRRGERRGTPAQGLQPRHPHHEKGTPDIHKSNCFQEKSIFL